MINTVLFDLDGTLLQLSQNLFVKTYLAKIVKVFQRLNMDAEECIKALWAGTEAMVLNDGSMLNAERFWEVFAAQLSLTAEQCRNVEAACNEFYMTEFDTVKSIMAPNEISERLVRALQTKGYRLVLATNPLFPSCAITTRLGWIGLTQQDFILVTHYTNSTYCKPNPRYYEEVFAKINRTPDQCLMVGNNATEDMIVEELGTETFLVTGCLENEADVDITLFRHGTLAELEEYLDSMPDISET